MQTIPPKQIDSLARARFSYREEGGDQWRSFADQVLAGEKWHGDCDDLASTVLDLAGRYGYSQEDRFRLLVNTEGRKGADHMVAVIRQGGTYWVVGDTYGPTYKLTTMKHRPFLYQPLTLALEDKWFGGTPLTTK